MSQPPNLDITPSSELQFVLSASEATPKLTLSLSNPTSKESIAFKVR